MKLPVPIPLCKQSITFTKVYQGKTDMFGEPVDPDDPVEIDSCVVQMATQYSGTNSDRQLLANGVVFLYAGVSSPFPTLTKDNLQSVVAYEGSNYKVTTIDEFQQPDGSGLFAYRLGVM